MKKYLFLFLLSLFAFQNLEAKKLKTPSPLKVSILGDSYSTFKGKVEPDTNLVYYPKYKNDRLINDVTLPEQTWWWLLIENNGLQLEKDNSYSGATVCNTGYSGKDYSDRSFLTRADNLGNPDIIIMFGGTNDSWADVPLGNDYRLRTKEAMYEFRPAFAATLEKLQKEYPKALIFNVSNSEIGKDITESMAEICEAYGVPNIQLELIDKQSGHPSINGMQQAARQIWRGMAPYVNAKKF